MPELLAGVEYAPLGIDDYLTEFWERLGRIEGVMWKLERRQVFREPGYPSWEAFAAGRIRESLALAETDREQILHYQQGLAEKGIESRRVRVVADPPTPYLWWESHILRIRSEAGERIRVVGATAVAAHESTHWLLPELVILGQDVLYDVQYDADGAATGAHRYEQAKLIRQCLDLIGELFDMGEPFPEYFRREIQPRDAGFLRGDELSEPS